MRLSRFLVGIVTVLAIILVGVTAIGAQAQTSCVNRITVWDNDTLSSIAARQQVNVNELAQVNGLQLTSRLQIGQVLCLDGLRTAQPATTPAPGTGGQVTPSPSATVTAVPTSTPVTGTVAPRTGFRRGQNPVIPAGWRTHVVIAGDNLFRIGVAYGVSMQSIAAANNITNTGVVFLDETLLIPPGTAQATVTAVPSGTPVTGTATPPPVTTIRFYRGQNPVIPEGWRTHNVVAGDNLFRISRIYGITAQSLAVANNVGNPGIVFLGETLLIPPGGVVVTSTAAPTVTAIPTSTPVTGTVTVTPAPVTGVIPTPPGGQNSIPVIGLNPVRAQPGDVVTVTGSNFPPNSSVEVYIEKQSTALKSGVLATATADANGNFTTTITIPATWSDGSPVNQRTVSISGYGPGGYWGMNFFVNLAGS